MKVVVRDRYFVRGFADVSVSRDTICGAMKVLCVSAWLVAVFCFRHTGQNPIQCCTTRTLELFLVFWMYETRNNSNVREVHH